MEPPVFDTPLSGINAEFLEALYQAYQNGDPSLPDQWVTYFKKLDNGFAKNATNNKQKVNGGVISEHIANADGAVHSDQAMIMSKQSSVFQLINAYRTFGHTRAQLDPLGRPHMQDPPDLSLKAFGLTQEDSQTPFSTGTLVSMPDIMTLEKITNQLKDIYCGPIGAEYMPLRKQEQRIWLQKEIEQIPNLPPFSPEIKTNILTQLTHAQTFETFLHQKFIGKKRFSLEGSESLVVMLNTLIHSLSDCGAKEVVMGMAHRGRLNTLVNVFKKDNERVFAEFEEARAQGEESFYGDVKYHKGYSCDTTINGRSIHLSLAFNPSHLEAVNPVVLGNVAAKQKQKNDQSRTEIVPVLLHGDASFAGQGLVMETLNLAYLEGYNTGGTVHIIINNQIGFTTVPSDSRSMVYSSDVIKMLNAAVLHVNADHPEAVWHVTRIAAEFRQRFNADIVVDLYCYRRLGHNEGDEPSFTQPLTYKKIKTHPSALTLYSNRLQAEGVLSKIEISKIASSYREQLAEALERTHRENIKPVVQTLTGAWKGLIRNIQQHKTASQPVNKESLEHIGRTLYSMPPNFNIHPRLQKLLARRKEMIDGKRPIDWGMGELLCYGSLVWEKFDVRFSGQDSRRGTFSHRHAVLTDVKTGEEYLPLQHLENNQGDFSIYNSPLSEAGVLGFEFGYSMASPLCLTIWEAQFGDFANGAQVIVDQFLASSEEKWLRMSGLVLLLPHGFEGMGPEHSSARIERFLQLCANNNIQIANPTTPAQFFHLMRRQLYSKFRRPLVVMSPKSLLRHPRAVSTKEELFTGGFHEVLPGYSPPNKDITRLVLCSGKIYYELLDHCEKKKIPCAAISRIEQMYPFPAELISGELARCPNLKEICWAQEEPKNMGGWDYIRPRLQELIGNITLLYAGRRSASSPATGSHLLHNEEQNELIKSALKCT